VLTLRAYAKVNLGLEIVGRRADGYHEVVTILQQIDRFDTLTFVQADEVTVTSTDTVLQTDANLALRAARLLRKVAGSDRGAAIHLEKRIPVAAGLGGGSSDAAATLVGLNRLWRLNLPLGGLADLGRSLGTDVPFFLRGGTQLATGRGDQLEPLPTPRATFVVIDEGDRVDGKTARLYGALRPSDFSDGQCTRQLAESLRTDSWVIPRRLVNGFERVARELFPTTKTYCDTIARAGGLPLLCGAGPSVASIHADASEARGVARRLQEEGYDIVVAAALPSVDTETCDRLAER